MEKTDKIEKRFGNALRNWRNQHGITQAELARRAILHRSYIADIERGARDNITLQNINKLADALEIPLWELFRF